MSMKPKIGQKLWIVKVELNDGVVQKHPITKELDFVDNHITREAWHVYHVTRNEAIDTIINQLMAMRH
jgi:hypothetical protein